MFASLATLARSKYKDVFRCLTSRRERVAAYDDFRSSKTTSEKTFESSETATQFSKAALLRQEKNLI